MTRVYNLYKMVTNGILKVTVINENDSVSESKLDNLHGNQKLFTSGFQWATNVMIVGKVAVVAGYRNMSKRCAWALQDFRA